MVRCFVRVCDLEIKNTINLDLDIIFCDCTLLVDGKHLLLERMVVRNCIYYWYLKVKTRVKSTGILAESL